ncbi:MAG: hypothetical protein JJ992_24700 [Planctomycetes bacterium]|nr:hypothetical protein [Planctomycetota bacterium]
MSFLVHRFGGIGRHGIVVLAAVSMLVLVGCGPSGPRRYNLSGNVTYGGQPIPAGSITLIPDVTQDNSGPAASMTIENGKFDSSDDGIGHVGGPHLVRITALDGQVSDEFPKGLPMFPPYETKVDLPKENSTQDFDVPKEWAPPPQAPVVDHGA